jgi:ABC-type oligopeptide transport system ATPase subunit
MSTEQPMPKALLELQGVNKSFVGGNRQSVVALQAVDLAVYPSETVAIVGESGSGKSTTARVALGLLRPDSGRVRFMGEDIYALSAQRLRRLRKSVQPIFQDPSGALNPRRNARELLVQAIEQRDGRSADLRREVVQALESVGLTPGDRYLSRFPHEMSGGQRQRLGIARAVAVRPKLIIADEPLSGADVSVRGSVLNLFIDLQKAFHLSYLFITHDISVARAFAHRVIVMHRGRIVEAGRPEEVIDAPRHAYTQQLVLAARSFEI